MAHEQVLAQLDLAGRNVQARLDATYLAQRGRFVGVSRRFFPRLVAEWARDDAGLPQAWVAMARASLRTCGPKFGAGRMIEDYATQIYPPT